MPCNSFPDLKVTERSFGRVSSSRGQWDVELMLKSSLAEHTARNAQKEKTLRDLKTLFLDLKSENKGRNFPVTIGFTERLAAITAETDQCLEETNILEFAHLKTQQSLVGFIQLDAKEKCRETEALLQRLNQHYSAALEASTSAKQLASQASMHLSEFMKQAESANKNHEESLSFQRKAKKSAVLVTQQSTHNIAKFQRHAQQQLENRNKLVDLLFKEHAEWKQRVATKQQSLMTLESYERGLSRIAE